MGINLVNWIKKYALIFGALGIYLIVALHKLTFSCLWFDETVEYWFSKVVVGKLPIWVGFADRFTNMYDRIVSTFQPPLYNVVMHFWLLINDTEWWFRFSGVVMGLCVIIALYRCLKYCCNEYVGVLGIILITFSQRFIYYVHECAEYILMLAMISWAIYFWVRVVKEQNVKDIRYFTLFAVLAVYSQYGAVFAVAGMGSVLLYCLFVKNKNSFVVSLKIYAIAAVFTMIPLWTFFLSKQLMFQHRNISQNEILFKNDNILVDLFESCKTVLRFILFDAFDSLYSGILLAIFIIVLLLVGVFAKSLVARAIIICSVITWMIYYIAVKLGVYANTEYTSGFDNRYALFLLPMWVVLIGSIISESYKLILNLKLSDKIKAVLLRLVIAVIICLLLVHAYGGWVSIDKIGQKERNIRLITEKWHSLDKENTVTLVWPASGGGFGFYLYHSDGMTDYDDIVYLKAEDITQEYVQNLVSNPEENYLIVFARGNTEDFDAYINHFAECGYSVENVCEEVDRGLTLMRKKK